MLARVLVCVCLAVLVTAAIAWWRIKR